MSVCTKKHNIRRNTDKHQLDKEVMKRWANEVEEKEEEEEDRSKDEVEDKEMTRGWTTSDLPSSSSKYLFHVPPAYLLAFFSSLPYHSSHLLACSPACFLLSTYLFPPGSSSSNICLPTFSPPSRVLPLYCLPPYPPK